jgi:hypothetical protein
MAMGEVGLSLEFWNWDTLIELMLGISLSAAAGFRVFVPLLALSAAAVLGHMDLPTQFDWVETPQALGLFAIAAILEVVGYSIPWVDHGLDLLSTPAAIAAGALVAASSSPELNSLSAWVLALGAGGGTAGLTKLLANVLRGVSTLATGGLGNPVFALLELGVAIALSVLALTVPLLAIALLIGFLGLGGYQLGRLIWRWTRGRVTP